MHKLKKGILLAGVCIIGLTGLTACESGNVKRGTVADGGSTNLEYSGSVIDNNTLGKAAKIEAVIDSSFYFGAEDEALEEGIYKGMVEALMILIQSTIPRKSMQSSRRTPQVSMQE